MTRVRAGQKSSTQLESSSPRAHSRPVYTCVAARRQPLEEREAARVPERTCLVWREGHFECARRKAMW